MILPKLKIESWNWWVELCMYKLNWISVMFCNNVKNLRMNLVMGIINHVKLRKDIKGNDLMN